MQSDVSSFFKLALRIKQGEPLSPLSFILFVNDIYSDLSVVDELGEVAGVSINQNCFFLLHFAEDMVIFSKDPMELQTLLEKLHVYSSEWGLRVIIRKTKLYVLENR